ncbi:hypothetical protein Bbelb_443510 [Branchiostoma belcheri]|nr:hypothetical protein Bbelb_443510 [Branchiostoma belcheri]
MASALLVSKRYSLPPHLLGDDIGLDAPSVLKIRCNTVVRPQTPQVRHRSSNPPRPSQDRPVPVNQAARWRGVIVSRRAPGLCHPGRTCPPVRPQILLCTQAHRRTDRGCTEVKADELDLSGSVPESCLEKELMLISEAPLGLSVDGWIVRGPGTRAAQCKVTTTPISPCVPALSPAKSLPLAEKQDCCLGAK